MGRRHGKKLLFISKNWLPKNTEAIDLTSEESSQRPIPKKHTRKSRRLLGINLVQYLREEASSEVNCIYSNQEYLGNTQKERKAACEKPRMVAPVNKPLAIDPNILMFSDRDLEDVHSPHDNVLVVKVQIFNALVRCIVRIKLTIPKQNT